MLVSSTAMLLPSSVSSSSSTSASGAAAALLHRDHTMSNNPNNNQQFHHHRVPAATPFPQAYYAAPVQQQQPSQMPPPPTAATRTSHQPQFHEEQMMKRMRFLETPGAGAPMRMSPPTTAGQLPSPQFFSAVPTPIPSPAMASPQIYYTYAYPPPGGAAPPQQQPHQLPQPQQLPPPSAPQSAGTAGGAVYYGGIQRDVAPQAAAAIAAYFAQANKFTPPPLASQGLHVQTRMAPEAMAYAPLESPIPTIAHLRSSQPMSEYGMVMAPHHPGSRFAAATNLISPKGTSKGEVLDEAEESRLKKQKKRESEVTRRTNLNDLVTIVEQAVLNDMNRMDRFADKVTVLECTARMLHEKYGLPNPSEMDYDSDASSTNEETQDLLSQPGLDRNTKKTLRERQRRKAMNRHLSALRKMLKVDESKDKKAVLNAVIEFLNEQKKKKLDGETSGEAPADSGVEGSNAVPTLASSSSSSSLVPVASATAPERS